MYINNIGLNMINKSFYGEKLQSLSYLEFGSIDFQSGTKNVYDVKMTDKAHDWLMNARYSNDIVVYKDMHNSIENSTAVIDTFNNEMHHADDVSLNISKWIALGTLQKHQLSFFELGQTLLGCIEGISLYKVFSHAT